jgi:superfamily II helicase
MGAQTFGLSQIKFVENNRGMLTTRNMIFDSDFFFCYKFCQRLVTKKVATKNYISYNGRCIIFPISRLV